MLNEFKNFFALERIQWELITLHNPWLNGVAERKNISIMGVSWAMLHDQGLPFNLWNEPCDTVVYVKNMSLHRIVEMSTPEECFSGKKPYVAHFKIFGSSVYYHVTKDAIKG